MAFATDGRCGIDFDRVTADEEFALGTTVVGSDHYAYVYVQANGAIAASQTDVSLNTSTFQASDGAGTYVNTTAFADNEHGWLRAPTVLSA